MNLTPEQRLLYSDPIWRHSVPRAAADRLWGAYEALEQRCEAVAQEMIQACLHQKDSENPGLDVGDIRRLAGRLLPPLPRAELADYAAVLMKEVKEINHGP